MSTILAPHGPLDRRATDVLRRQLAMLSVAPSAQVVLELGAVPSIDRAVAQSIADASARLRRTGGRLTLRRLAEQHRSVLAGFGLA